MIPDGAAEIGLTCLAGLVGWLARAVTELRARTAVVEARQEDRSEDMKRLEGKVDRLCDLVSAHLGESCNISASPRGRT